MSIVPEPVSDAILAFLSEPHSACAVADHIGRPERTATHYLLALKRRSFVVRVGFGIYAVAGYGGTAGPPLAKQRPGDPSFVPKVVRPTRSQPICDAILAFLSEPRSARAVADHIGRPVRAATGYLFELRMRALVVRVGGCRYASAAYDGYAGPFVRTGETAAVARSEYVSRRGRRPDDPASVPKVGRSSRPQPIRDAILAFLSEPRSARAVADHIDRPVPTATGHLAAMRRRGMALRIGFSAYAPADYLGPPLDFSPGPRGVARPASIRRDPTLPARSRSRGKPAPVRKDGE